MKSIAGIDKNNIHNKCDYKLISKLKIFMR